MENMMMWENGDVLVYLGLGACVFAYLYVLWKLHGMVLKTKPKTKSPTQCVLRKTGGYGFEYVTGTCYVSIMFHTPQEAGSVELWYSEKRFDGCLTAVDELGDNTYYMWEPEVKSLIICKFRKELPRTLYVKIVKIQGE